MQQQTDNRFTIDQVRVDAQHDYVLAEEHDGVHLYRKVMTESEMYQTAVEDWLGVLSQLWTAYGKDIHPDQMVVYQKSLFILPLGLLDAAIQRVIREHTYASVPTLGQVWAAVRKELDNPHDLDEAIQRWMDQQWRQTVYTFHADVAVETEAA